MLTVGGRRVKYTATPYISFDFYCLESFDPQLLSTLLSKTGFKGCFECNLYRRLALGRRSVRETRGRDRVSSVSALPTADYVKEYVVIQNTAGRQNLIQRSGSSL